MNFIKKIHLLIKLLKTSLREFFLKIKMKKNTTTNNYHYYYDQSNSPLFFNKLCKFYKTDKGFIENNYVKSLKKHQLKPHTYGLVYHNLFNHSRENINLVFEFGIGTNDTNIPSNMTTYAKIGASLKLWRDYFPKAKIYAADIDDKILFQEERIKTFKVNQLNTRSIKRMWLNINKNNFDLIIDDGLHTCEASFNSFINSFKNLRSGGIYIIEDVHYSYLYNLANKLKKYNPEIIISKNKYLYNYNIKNNNLIIIRKS
jgi:hypothetical protein